MSDNNESTHDLTPAERMEAQEREQVIEDSVDDLQTFAGRPLSDAEIEAQRLHLRDIKPKPDQDGGS